MLERSGPRSLRTRIHASVAGMWRHKNKPGIVSTVSSLLSCLNRQRQGARLGIFFLMIALVGNMAACSLPPIPITDWYGLDAVRNNLGARYYLANDLDSTTPGYESLAGYMAKGKKGWQPIGTSDAPFTGSFDGQGHQIKDLFINRPDEDDVGLFGFVGQSGIVKDVDLVNAVVIGRQDVGGLAGTSAGAVLDCCFRGRLTGERYVGALVGANAGIVGNSHYSYDEVLINGKRMITIGALPGEDFVQWLANGKFLDINQRLSREDGYYLISDVSEFRELLAFGQDSALKFRLTTDLDLAGETDFYVPYMAGELDGSGHRIRNFTFNSGPVSEVGLFGYLAFGGMITQLGLENAEVTGGRVVGGLVGRNDGAVGDCYCRGNVVGDDYVGGLIGHNEDGVVSNSHSAGAVSGKWHVGGLVGVNEATVTNSYSTNNVHGWGSAGGLTGVNAGTVTNSYSTGTVAGWESAGGLVGLNLNRGSLSNSYSTASVEGWTSVGGLAGISWGSVSKCYALGAVTGRSRVGGLIGGSYGSLRDCHAGGDVIGEVDVGGLIGSNYGSVRKSYATGSVTGEWNVGGLIGENYGSVNDCYFEGDTTGSYCVGGLTGENSGSLSNCRSAGSVAGRSHVGGLAASNSGTITTSYSSCSVTGSSVVSSLVAINNRGGTVGNSYSAGSVVGDYYVAGLIGVNFGVVSKSYSSGSVTGQDYVGGLLAVNWGGTATDCLWDMETSGQSTSAAGTAKTTAEMHIMGTFVQVGWNIRSVAPGTTNTAFIWNIVEGQTYPFLSWQSRD